MTRWNGNQAPETDRHQVGLWWVVLLTVCLLFWAVVIWLGIQAWGWLT